jgi:hypothetical protein
MGGGGGEGPVMRPPIQLRYLRFSSDTSDPAPIHPIKLRYLQSSSDPVQLRYLRFSSDTSDSAWTRNTALSHGGQERKGGEGLRDYCRMGLGLAAQGTRTGCPRDSDWLLNLK